MENENQNLPKISIVIVSYNQGEYLEKTIKSVVDQKYPNLECILIDGGSTDNSVEIIKKYQEYFKFWVSEKDNGQSDAILKGLNYCTGDIFNWLCSDDYYEPDALINVGKAFKDENTHLAYGNVRQFGGKWGDGQILKGTRLKESLPKSIVDSFITQPVTFWRTKYFIETELNGRLHWYMDYEMWVKYLFRHNQLHVKYIDKLIAHYLFHDSSKSNIESDYTQTNKSSKYKIEMNSIYYSIAKKIGYKKLYNVIPSLSSELLEDYDLNIDLSNKKDLAISVLNYYVFINAVRYYWINDFEQALYLFKNVDKTLLSIDDKKKYKTLKGRCTREPFAKYLRKFKLKLKSK